MIRTLIAAVAASAATAAAAATTSSKNGTFLSRIPAYIKSELEAAAVDDLVLTVDLTAAKSMPRKDDLKITVFHTGQSAVACEGYLTDHIEQGFFKCTLSNNENVNFVHGINNFDLEVYGARTGKRYARQRIPGGIFYLDPTVLTGYYGDNIISDQNTTYALQVAQVSVATVALKLGLDQAFDLFGGAGKKGGKGKKRPPAPRKPPAPASSWFGTGSSSSGGGKPSKPAARPPPQKKPPAAAPKKAAPAVPRKPTVLKKKAPPASAPKPKTKAAAGASAKPPAPKAPAAGGFPWSAAPKASPSPLAGVLDAVGGLWNGANKAVASVDVDNMAQLAAAAAPVVLLPALGGGGGGAAGGSAAYPRSRNAARKKTPSKAVDSGKGKGKTAAAPRRPAPARPSAAMSKYAV